MASLIISASVPPDPPLTVILPLIVERSPVPTVNVSDPAPLELRRREEDRGMNRLVPDESFPPYAFVPGRFPHPTADPAGHSFGTNPALPSRVEPDQWQVCRPYLYGIDLFNGGYYWESHVAWEGLWMACGRKGMAADFLKTRR